MDCTALGFGIRDPGAGIRDLSPSRARERKKRREKEEKEEEEGGAG